jgi:TPR repeat protein
MLADNLFELANKEWDAGHRREAFRLFSQAAALGHTSAQNSLGYFYDLGIGVPKSRRKAVFWYRKAASKGDMCASGNLAISYRDAGNTRRAKFWFAKALGEGDADAALELAKLHLKRANSASQRNLQLVKRYLTMTAMSKEAFSDSKEEARKLLEELKAAPPSGKKRRYPRR